MYSLKTPGQQPRAAVVYFQAYSFCARSFRLADVLRSVNRASGLCSALPLISHRFTKVSSPTVGSPRFKRAMVNLPSHGEQLIGLPTAR
jgi:hypothetical protein